jgi:hypothetical protein
LFEDAASSGAALAEVDDVALQVRLMDLLEPLPFWRN